jgi:hypothetical protein
VVLQRSDLTAGAEGEMKTSRYGITASGQSIAERR